MHLGDRARAFLEGSGTCGRLIAGLAWSTTSLGSISAWPASLTATVANMLHSRQPMLLFWGPDLLQFYNDAFIPSFGEGKHPQAMGQPARACWADAWPVIGAQIDAVMSRGEPAWHEDALVPIARNGRMEEVFWTYSYSPAFDDRGKVHGTLVIVTETTGRVLFSRRLEALARLGVTLPAAASYEAAFEALGKIVAEWPADLQFLVIRDASGRSTQVGLDAASADRIAIPGSVSRELSEVTLDPPIVGSVWPEPIGRALACAIGTRHQLLVGLNPRLPFDEAYRSFVAQIVGQLDAVLRRIDDANEMLAVQRQRDNLLMQAPVATALMTGPNHVFQLANPHYRKLVGRDPTGRPYLEAFPELVETPLPGILARVYETGEPFVATEQRVPLDRSGTGRLEDCYINFNLEPIRGEDGRICGMMAVAVDITEQVRARITLEKSDEDRSRMVLALQDADRLKDEFLAMLGHELRNPLAPIVTALELLDQKHAAGGPERAIIERQVKHVIRLVDDLLDVSKITRGLVTLDLAVLDLRDVVHAAVDGSRHLIQQRGHHLVVDSPGPVLVRGDLTRLIQVVLNLLTNAARYTPDGGNLRLTLAAEGQDAVLRVEDSGVGITSELLPRLFDTFVQGARSADRAEGGLGLGLSIVKNLISLHGGTVSAQSEGRGKGSVFTIRLARVDELPARTERVAAPAAVSASRRVLIVDDNEDAALLLGEIARMRGHDVTVVHDPESALAIVGELVPEIAVLDIGLPGMDGYELAARVRERCPDCRLVALTGYGQAGDRERSRQAGFAEHLVKPVHAEQLLAVLAHRAGAVTMSAPGGPTGSGAADRRAR